MLGKQTPLTNEVYHGGEGQLRESQYKHARQLEYMVDKCMHLEHMLHAKELEIKKQEMKYSTLEQKCVTLFQRVKQVEQHVQQNLEMRDARPAAPPVTKPVFQIVELDYLELIGRAQTAYQKKKVADKHLLVKAEAENIQLKVILQEFFEFAKNIVTSLSQVQEFRVENTLSSQQGAWDGHTSAHQLAQLLLKSQSLVFPECDHEPVPLDTQRTSSLEEVEEVGESEDPEQKEPEIDHGVKLAVQDSQQTAERDVFDPPYYRPLSEQLPHPQQMMNQMWIHLRED